MTTKNKIQEKKAPVVRPLNQLPEFVQACVGKLWEKYGTPENVNDLVYTFHDAIYTKNPMPTDVFVHECVHFVRQGSGEDLELSKQWCMRYVDDPQFRYDEELLAYREQYKFIKRKYNRAQSFDYAKYLAGLLSGPMYANIASFNQSLHDIIKE